MTYLQMLGDVALEVGAVLRARKRLLDSADPELDPEDHALLERGAYLFQQLKESLRDELALRTATGLPANLMPPEVLHDRLRSSSIETQ